MLALWKNISNGFYYQPQGQLQVHGGVGKCCPEALTTWVIGILFNILALWKEIFGILWYNPQGHLQAQGGVEIWSVEALTSTVLKLLALILGTLFNILALWIEIIGILWYHLQGQLQAEGVAKCSSEALSINSFEAFNMNFGVFC